ncbi:two-component system response regulator YesN [Paenibacillus sp. BK033]|uniref:response regulator n=1 Tax=Paenibacillus sp. BK033 TaxID=2512133 RepID=UPI001048EBB9|nr:response regulator [Paenibacillus sp. BK033]TCM99104.1 two-component system response regulator YesN [Paenibacillus sp. BK033]
MHRILIVDDERIEREGIRNLIRKLKLELDPLVAENGEAALQIVRSEPVDIVITDIKMPFMDGLELSEKIREEHPDIELIIYSAFNEFEYARRAMRANVSNYLLKPIQVPEFLAAIQRATDACLEKEADRKRELQLLEGYRLGMAYEREKMLLDAINGTRPMKPPAAARIDDAEPESIHLLLVECPRHFFDMHNDDFLAMLHERLNLPFDYLNVNENQSLLFIRHPVPLSRETLRFLAETVSASTLERYGQTVGIIVGAAAEGWDGVHSAYCGIERLLEFKFFMNEQAILFAEEHFSEASFDEVELQSISDKIYQCVNFSDLRGAKYGVELLFSYLKTTGHFSSLYTKFLCSEIMNKLLVKEHKKSLAVINDYLDKISRSSSLHELKDLMLGVFDLVESCTGARNKEESANRIIEQIKQMIEERYDQDLSLEGIAEQVYLTPSYLSYLFKKETGQSLIRYITQVRMDKAVVLLRDTNMKIVDICQKLGYRNSNYFIQSFRQHYGVTPAKYRERTP